MSPDEIVNLLGIEAVLLPIREGTKRPTRQSWQRLTFSDTKSRSYQGGLAKAPAIGVSLGKASGGLCTIDCDDEAFLVEMLDLNPLLRGTLRTSAKRGGNLWFVLTDPPPPIRKLTREDEAVGEFRSTGSQTIITGAHPEGLRYRMIVEAAPVRLVYADIVWPAWMAHPHTPHLSQYSQYSKSSPGSQCSPSLDTLHNIRERFDAAEAARIAMEENLPLKRLYQRFVVSKRPVPRSGRRNSDLIELVTFLHGATGEKRTIELARAFWELNQDIFNDGIKQHLHEAEVHFAACEESWRKELLDTELNFVDQLPQAHREAFRICRDLAYTDSEESPRGKFFISMGDLAERISLKHAPEAQRILIFLESRGCLEIETKGTRHTKGARGVATRYRWLLEMP